MMPPPGPVAPFPVLPGRRRGRPSSSSSIVAAAATGAAAGYNDEWCIDGDDDGALPPLEAAAPSSSSSSSSRRRRRGDLDLDDDDYDDDDQRSYFATCIPGLHESLAKELVDLGARMVETTGRSGVRFVGSPRIGMRSLLWCRTAHRIMELVASSSSSSSSSDPPPRENRDDHRAMAGGTGVRNREDLYDFVRDAVHVPSLLGDGKGGLLTLSVRTTYAGSGPPNRELCHGHFTALTVKNALVDAARELREDGVRPDVDVDDSDVPLVVVLRGRRVGGEEDEAGGGDRPGEYRGGGGDRGRGGGRVGGRGGGRRDGYDAEEDGGWETVADVDLYRGLHSGGSLHRRGYRREGSVESGEPDDDYDDNDGGGRRRRPPPSPGGGGGGTVHKAAMKETLAAGLLLEAGWDKLIDAARADGLRAVLVDPMTGSATLPAEAALIACDVAPGLVRIGSWRDGVDRDMGAKRRKGGGGVGGGDADDNPHRRPPCTRWKDFGKPGEWDDLLAEATRRARAGREWAAGGGGGGGGARGGTNSNVRILCNEKNVRAAGLAESSVRNAGVGDIVSLRVGDCADWDLGGYGGQSPSSDDRTGRGVVEGRTIFVCNPPWGLRLTDDIDESWVSLREFLRREAVGCESWVLSGNKDLTKILRMKKVSVDAMRNAVYCYGT